ncbi:hypothetical protein [Vreelandella venusta]|uniref:hypothetical protein n=1 Tax=Vreelandella venusta TaxID=44935 RepID=UPI003C2CF69F
MMEFLEAHANIFLALGGAVGGALISLVVGWLLRKRDYDLRLWDKLLERRIQAHENLIKIALEMRVMVAPGTVDAEGEVVRAPQVLVSQEAFEQWFTSAISGGVAGSTWLATDAKREANFLQDYLVTLHLHLQPVASENYLSVGCIIRQDFIDISASLERAAFRFFEKDARRLKLSSLDEWHKYPREQTEKRLNDTQLLQRWSEWSPLAQESDACGS